MAVYTVNATMGPVGLCPMVLVLGSLLRPDRSYPSASQLHRQVEIKDSRKEVSAKQARRFIAFYMRHPSMPKAKEMSEKLRDLPAGSPVLFYQNASRLCEGAFKLIKVDRETMLMQFPGR